MTKSKTLKRIGLFCVVLLALVIGLGVFIDYWVNKSLPQILNQNPDRTYNIEYSRMYFSLLRQSIFIENIDLETINPSKTESSLDGKIKSIQIKFVQIPDLLLEKKIRSRKVVINTPRLEIISRKADKAAADNSKSINLFWEDLYNSIELQNVVLKEGKLRILNEGGTSERLSSEDINIVLREVHIDTLDRTTPLPFEYESFELSIGKTSSALGENYRIKVGKFSASNTDLDVEDIDIKPTISRSAFDKKIRVETDYIHCKLSRLRLKNTAWKFHEDSLYVDADKLDVDSIKASFYRNKTIADNPSKKLLYNAMLRKLPFLISIDSFDVERSEIVVKQKFQYQNDLGRLFFKDVHIVGSHLSNYNYWESNQKTKLHFQSSFMDSGRLDAHLSFLVLDPKDQYQFRGSLNHLQLEDINPFIEPNFNVKSQGTIHSLDFNIHGADYDASALVNMEYDDLKIELINAKKHKKAWFKSLKLRIQKIIKKKGCWSNSPPLEQ